MTIPTPAAAAYVVASLYTGRVTLNISPVMLILKFSIVHLCQPKQMELVIDCIVILPWKNEA